jgi:hypothetical protein
MIVTCQLMFIDVASKEKKCKEEINKSKTDPC